MATPTYEEVLERARQLTIDEQLRLIADLATIIRENITRPKHSVMEFRGTDKELDKGVDVEKPIGDERSSEE